MNTTTSANSFAVVVSLVSVLAGFVTLMRIAKPRAITHS